MPGIFAKSPISYNLLLIKKSFAFLPSEFFEDCEDDLVGKLTNLVTTAPATQLTGLHTKILGNSTYIQKTGPVLKITIAVAITHIIPEMKAVQIKWAHILIKDSRGLCRS